MSGRLNVMGQLRRRHRLMAQCKDAGTSMIELFVAMVLMTICGSIFTGAIVTLYRTNDAAQAVTTSAQQTNQAYQTLDRTVRYSSAISLQGKSSGASGDWYVELRNTTDGSERCTQLRLDIASGQLQRRTWASVDPAGTKTNWQPLASGLTNGSVADGSEDMPFKVSTVRRQVVRIVLIAKSGPITGVKTSRSSFTLTAVNSPVNSPSTPASGICQQLGRP